MGKIWMLAKANIRKSKGQSVSLLIFVLIAAMFLNIGLVMYFDIGSFFDERAELLHAEHFMAIYEASGAVAEASSYIADDPRVAEAETLNAIGNFGNYTMNGNENTAYIYFTRMDENKKIGAPSLVGDYLPLTSDAIYVPYFIALNSDIKIGDSFSVALSGTDLTFRVAGFTEEIMLGAQMNTVYRFYVSDEKYGELAEKFPDVSSVLFSARFGNVEDASFFIADFNKTVSLDGVHTTITIEGAKQARIMVPQIAAAIVVAFALILLIVSLIVIRFRIISSIEESMTNIGALKAVGYRNRQIVSSIVCQFTVIALVGGLVGTALAYTVMPFIVQVLKPMFALDWTPGFDALFAALSFFALMCAVILASFLAARRINKLHPLIALRGGITTHSFRKNSFPLDKSHGSLSFLLALKQISQSKKQAVTITIIIAAVTMASVVGINLHYNMSEKRENFAKSFFGEMPDANFVINPGEDGEAFLQTMLERPEVRKAYGYQNPALFLVDEIGASAVVAEDFSPLESNLLIDGRYPKHPNEIALGPVMLKVIGKEIGDMVTVKCGDNEKDYLVTGIVQYVNNNGLNGVITGAGLAEIQPDFTFVGYNVYLTEGTDANAFIEKVKSQEGDILYTVIYADDIMNSMLDSIGGIFAAVAAGIAAVTVCVVVLTLYMVIKTVILRRRRELGIQKAVGFTTFQLMNQISLNMTPIILVGVVLGAVAGYIGLNPMVAAMMSSMGIVRSTLATPLDRTMLVCAALVVLAYAVSMLVAWRIRKISAYSLISE